MEGPGLSIVRAGLQCVCEVAAPWGPTQSWPAPELGAQTQESKHVPSLEWVSPEDVDSGPDHSLSLVDRQLSAPPRPESPGQM